MKKLIILTLLAFTSCTSIRKDDHSYTYIHNFNSSSEEKPAKQLKNKRESDQPSEDYPFYDNGFQPSAVVEDFNDHKDYNNHIDSNNYKNPYTVTHNHYYPQRTATYTPTPSYSGFAPSARRYLIQGEIR
jgi:hypothetical protein